MPALVNVVSTRSFVAAGLCMNMTIELASWQSFRTERTAPSCAPCSAGRPVVLADTRNIANAGGEVPLLSSAPAVQHALNRGNCSLIRRGQ